MSIAAVLTPRVRVMVICDGIRPNKIEADVFDLKGVRQSITVPAFPFRPSRLWLFLLLSSPRAGDFPAYVRVVNDKDDRVVFHSNLYPRPVFEIEGGVLPYRTLVRCTFPEEGSYSVQVWFFHEEGSGILKGEMPFFVAREGS
jgi:hypothetical protein